MRKSAKVLIALLSAALLTQFPNPVSAQVAAGDVNDFEDGTTQGWLINLLGMGAPPPDALPTNVASGGPAGVDDNYLRLNSFGGGGAGSRMMTINPVLWGGDYLASGITAIRFDAINLGATDLSLRFLLEDPLLGPPTNIAASFAPVNLLAGSGWQSLVFPLFGPSGLAALEGSVEEAMRNATVARIYHSSAFAFPPEPIVASLGLDNIRAVPEPSSMVLLSVVTFAAALLRRRKPA